MAQTDSPEVPGRGNRGLAQSVRPDMSTRRALPDLRPATTPVRRTALIAASIDGARWPGPTTSTGNARIPTRASRRSSRTDVRAAASVTSRSTVPSAADHRPKATVRWRQCADAFERMTDIARHIGEISRRDRPDRKRRAITSSRRAGGALSSHPPPDDAVAKRPT